jgi:flavodoxin I/flavodoxin II
MSHISDLEIGLIFGSDTGNTEDIGNKISEAIEAHGGSVEMINVDEASTDELEGFDFIIMGIPTWDFGGIQADWDNFEGDLEETDLSGKLVALYGLGDQEGYDEWFLDAMGWLRDGVAGTGATLIGSWSTEGYNYKKSKAENADKSLFCGLGIDEDGQPELTDQRVQDWVTQLIKEIEMAQAA